MLKSTDEYGALLAVLPTNWDTLLDRLSRRSRPGRGRASVLADTGSSFVLADIINYDRIPYSKLNIEPGLNCLWIHGAPGDPRTWEVTVRKATSCVALEGSRFRVSRPLEIKIIPYSDLGDYSPAAGPPSHPSTARWGWDGQTQYIGIHCGRAWCEIGPHGFVGSRARIGDNLGLRDEQYLAEVDSSVSPPRLHPSHVWGLIQPEPALGRAQDPDLAPGLHVATITLVEGQIGARQLSAALRSKAKKAWEASARGTQQVEPTDHAHKVYFQRFKLQLLAPAASFTEIWMKNVGKDRYDIATKPEADAGRWTPTVRCPWPHASVGAVRWRWDAGDEAVWIACTTGCCTAAGIN